MKKLLISAALAAVVASALAVSVSPTGEIVITWPYPWKDLSTGSVFRVYERTNVITGQWQVASTVQVDSISPPAPGTDTVSFASRLRVSPGLHYFAITYSNFWGEGDFGEVVSTPALPKSGIKAGVERVDVPH